MLLLVLQAELHQARGGMCRVVGDATDQPPHRVVHVGAVPVDLAHRRASHEPALRPAMAFAGLHVVRVEEVGVSRVGGAIRRVERREHEGLEEPARMREVPLGRAHVRHRADDVILDLERSTQPFGLRAHTFVAGQECGG